MTHLRIWPSALRVVAVLIVGACSKSDSPSTPVIATPVVTQVHITLARTTIQTSDTVTAVAIVLDQRGQPMTGHTVTWRSSDTTLASVSTGGVVFGETSGSLAISATVAGMTGSATLVVQKSLRFRKWLAIRQIADSILAFRYREGGSRAFWVLDLNGDHYADLMEFLGLPKWQPATVRVYRSLGDTLYRIESTAIKTIIGSNIITIGDFNGDGRDDVFAPSFGVDEPPFPGAQQRLFLQTTDGTLQDRSDLMPSRAFLGHAGCASQDRRRLLAVGGQLELPMKHTGSSFVEQRIIKPTLDFTQQAVPWDYSKGSYMSFWDCTFVDADGDGVEDVLLASGNFSGRSSAKGQERTKDIDNNDLGAAHVVLYGERDSDTVRYTFPTSKVVSGSESLTLNNGFAFIQHVTTDLDGDGCNDVALIGSDYLSNEIVDIIKGCLPRGANRLLASYRFDIRGTLGNIVNEVPGLPRWHPWAASGDVNHDGIPDLILFNDDSEQGITSVAQQMRIGIGDGRGTFSWRAGQNADFWAMPLSAQVNKSWKWDPRAR